jgi:beta-xylosidase
MKEIRFKLSRHVLCTLPLLLNALLASAQHHCSFIPGAVWSDNNGIAINAHGGGLLYDRSGETYYWFGEHKIEGEAGNLAQVGVHCYSSKDLYNWNDEGIALPVMPENSDSDIAQGCILERPKVIYNASTGKYVMWFHLEIKSMGYSSARSGVAVSDNPAGPYTFVRSERPDKGFWPKNGLPVHRSGNIPSKEQEYSGGSLPAHPDSLNLLGRDFEGGQMARDMTLFVDDDGAAYHIYSSEENSTMHISRLSDDYLSHRGEYVRLFVNRFMEAPALFKRHGKYYLIASGCTGWEPNEARSAVAESIWGPWEELGNPCRGEQSDITFGAQSTYVFPVAGKTDAYIFMADRWNPQNAIDGRYIWLPVDFENDKPVIYRKEKWKL